MEPWLLTVFFPNKAEKIDNRYASIRCTNVHICVQFSKENQTVIFNLIVWISLEISGVSSPKSFSQNKGTKTNKFEL